MSYYMASRLAEIREEIHLIHSIGQFYPEEIVSAKPGDVCIAYLFPRYSKTSTIILSWMRTAGAKIVLITSNNYNIIEGYGDIILPCSVDSISYKDSMVGPMCLSNYLIAEIAHRDKKRTNETLQKTENILNQDFYLGF